jgi:formylmethanofuran dehydrogenase subunit E
MEQLTQPIIGIIGSSLVIEVVPLSPPIIEIVPQPAPKRTRRPKWTYDRFIAEAKRVHGDKYDYSQIQKTDINGYKSRIKIICRECGNNWETSIDPHIRGSGCAECKGLAKYTLEKFLKRAREIHGEKFDYSEVGEEHIHNKRSQVPIRCKECGHRWSPEISNHINNKTGCPECAENVPYTLERFLQRAKEVYGETAFDYSEINEDQIAGNGSCVPITCLECKYEWTPTIDHHLNRGTGCPECNEHGSWNLKRLLRKAEETHGDDFDYSLVTEEHIQNSRSHIPVRCRECEEVWQSVIHDHISRREGCPNCRFRAPWTLARLKIKGKRIHRDRYDYSKVEESHVKDSSSRIPVSCTICNNLWWPTINNHINHGTGCNKCFKSKGELACEEALTDFRIPFESEYVLPSLSERYFDFAFVYNGRWYFIEFDGIQHFQLTPKFHVDEEHLKENQQVDVIKTWHAIHYGYIIRIDYTQIDSVKQHIINALQFLNDSQRVYYSTPEMYRHIISAF